MKKFTLLAGIALLAGSGVVAAQTEIYGLKMSTDTQKYYYRISNMRAQRLSYTTGNIYGEDGYTENDTIGHDGGMYGMPDTIPGGQPTPEIYSFPYMGLSNLAGNWWVGFSAQEDVMSPYTTYWYFTENPKRKGSVFIHNAVIDGTIKRAAQLVTGVNGIERKTMGFDLNENFYYVIKALNGPENTTGLGLKDQEWFGDLSLSDEQKESAYAFCVASSYTATSGTCLDMNNYITPTMSAIRIDENGDTIKNNNGEPTFNYYGFAGVDRTWSPIRSTGGNNINHYANNGTLFFVERHEDGDKTTDQLAAEAIEAYKEVIAKGFRDGAIEGAKQNFAEVISILEGWANVPMLWSDTDALNAIIEYCTNWNGEGLDVSKVYNLETRLAFEAEAKKLAEAQLTKAAELIGSEPVVTFQNQLAYRDLADWLNNDEATNEENQLGDAYITAGGEGTALIGSDVFPLIYNGIVPTLEKDADGLSEWTLKHVAGTPNFLLYNEASNTYIRQYKGMYDLAGGEGEVGAESEVSEFSWATTEDASEAAPFLLKGCPNPAEQATVTEEEMIFMDDAGINYLDVANNVRLCSSYEEVTPGEGEDAEPVVTVVETNIHRGSKSSYYKFINWRFTKNWWFADTNVFNVDLVKEGSISEIAAETVKNNAIYDLQGRRVSKAGKGIYIINGVKTLVR